MRGHSVDVAPACLACSPATACHRTVCGCLRGHTETGATGGDATGWSPDTTTADTSVWLRPLHWLLTPRHPQHGSRTSGVPCSWSSSDRTSLSTPWSATQCTCEG